MRRVIVAVYGEFSPKFSYFRDNLRAKLIEFNMSENVLAEYDSFYFIGVGGVSMSALAKILLALGKRVGGCDRSENEYTRELQSAGVPFKLGNLGDIEGFSAVVYTDAIPESNATFALARRQNKFIISRGELLYELSKLYTSTIAISGCHGKTTCTAMLAHIFDASGLEFTLHVGGSDNKFSNGYFGGKRFLITEACEYKKNFLYLKPAVGVILNSDADHLDCYGSAENLRKAYAEFASSSTEVVRLFGDLDGVEGTTFGFDDRADYYAKKIRNERGRFSFGAYEGDIRLGTVTLGSYGKHNVLNALAAIAVARRCGVGFDAIAAGLKSFTGVKRRFEVIGSCRGAVCIADYAHHPNEIKAVLKTARLVTQGEVFVVFQPHTYSRTKNLFKQFVAALSPLKRLLIYKTYAAREYYDDAGSALTLSSAVKRSVYGDCEDDILNFISGAGQGDIVLFLGAGDIYDIAKYLLG